MINKRIYSGKNSTEQKKRKLFRRELKSTLNFGILISLILFSTIIFSFRDTLNPKFSGTNTQINTSASINDPIFIDGDAVGIGAYNWSWAETQDWCTGSGIIGDPYIIRDVIIDGEESSIPIQIINSDSYLRIENCTVYETSSVGGIVLTNVNNTIISDCISQDNYYCDGMSLTNCYNITVEDNTVFNNRYRGFDISNCPNIRILNNNVSRTSYSSVSYGIFIRDSDYSMILNNEIYYVRYGISIGDSNHTLTNGNNLTRTYIYGIGLSGLNINNTISENTVDTVTYLSSINGNGIQITNIYDFVDDDILQENSTIENNYISNCEGAGIRISGSYYEHHREIVVFNNTIESSKTGIYHRYSYFGLVANNTINDCDTGIVMESNNLATDVKNNRMIGGGMSIDMQYGYDIELSNTVDGKMIYYYRNQANLDSSNFTFLGPPAQIMIRDCDNSIIDGFTFSNIVNPIIVYRCDNLSITNNIIQNTTGTGIGISSSNFVNVSYNDFYYNDGNGLYMSGCDNSTIEYNNAYFNHQYGLRISSCDDSTIHYNNASFNDQSGFYISGVNNTIFYNNASFNSGGYGLYAGCVFSEIKYNFAYNNSYGIYLSGAHDTEVFNNTAFNNTKYGIRNSGSDNLNITKNFVYDNGEYGIYVSYAENYKQDEGGLINNNTMYNNGLHGILIEESSNITVKYNKLTSNGKNIIIDSKCNNISLTSNTIINGEIGISCDYSNNTKIESNVIIDCVIGLSLYRAENLYLSNNEITNGTINIFGSYLDLRSYLLTWTVLFDNTVDGKMFYFYKDTTNLANDSFTILGDPYMVILVNCNDTIFGNLEMTQNEIGILLYSCHNITILDSKFSNNTYGLVLGICSQIIINNSDFIYNSEHGIYSLDSYEITIEACNISYNLNQGIGISTLYLYNNHHIKIINNDLFYNGGAALNLLGNEIEVINNRIYYNHYLTSIPYYYYSTIYAWNCNNLTIKDNIIKNNNNLRGINLGFNYGYCKFINNTFENMEYVLYIDEDLNQLIFLNNTVINCTVNNGFGFIHELVELSGNTLINSDFSFGYLPWSDIEWNIPLNNIINGKIMYFYANVSGLTTSNFTFLGDPSRIILMHCNNSVINNFQLTNIGEAILLYKCNNITISNSYITFASDSGILISECIYVSVEDCIISDSENGIRFFGDSDYINIRNNEIYNNRRGIFYSGYIWNELNEFQIEHNSIRENEYGIAGNGLHHSIIRYNQFIDNENSGIYLSYSRKVTIEYNEFLANIDSGIYLDFECDNTTIYKNNFIDNYYGIQCRIYTDYNLIYLNNFTNNQINALDNSTENFWDNGSIGNYWDDYNGIDVNKDGIGDTPYDIAGTGNAKDNFPIVQNIPASDETLMWIIVISLIIVLLSITVLLVGRLFFEKVKPQKKRKIIEPMLSKPSTIVIKQESKITTSQLPTQNVSEATIGQYDSQQMSTNKIYKAITNRSPHLKEYLETNKLIEEIPEMNNFITSLSDPELIRKINFLNLTMEESGLLMEDLVNLNPEERTKLINKMLKNLK